MENIPCASLPLSVRDVILRALDLPLIRETLLIDGETKRYIYRDYRGLAQLLDVDAGFVVVAEEKGCPTDCLLTKWQQMDQNLNVGTLFETFEKLTRYDIIDDLKECIGRLHNLTEDTSLTDSAPIELVPRDAWGAREPRGRVLLIHRNVRFMLIHNVHFDDVDDPVVIAQRLQRRSMDAGSPDINCNFLISSKGIVYEGSGWKFAAGNSSRYTRRSIIFTLIGKYDSIEPDQKMMDALFQLIQNGVAGKFVSRLYGIYGMNYVDLDGGPGEKVLEVIQKWPRYQALGNIEERNNFL